MIRNLKVLGLALGAVFAFSAMAASSASAVDTFTTSTGTSDTVTGLSHDNIFEITGNGAFVACTTSHFSGTINNGSAHATINATYTGIPGATPHTNTECETLLGATAAVNMNGCDYDLTGTTTGLDEGSTDATVSITCTPSTNEITITTTLGAVLKIPAQTPTSGGVTYTNENGKVKVKATATGITYTCSSAFACGLAGIPTEGNSAHYKGTIVVGSTTAGRTIEYTTS